MRQFVATVTITLSLVAGGPLAVGDTTLRLRDVITLPDGYTGVVSLEDLDGDKMVDLVIWKWSTGGGMKVLECDDQGNWVQRFEYKPNVCRYVAVADADLDGYPEIAIADQSTVVMYEASGDNTYKLVHKSEGYHSKIEIVRAGDTNGDDREEFIVAQEGAWVHMIEGTGDNTYRILGPAVGHGYDCSLAGVYDLDNDGEPSLMFHDNEGLNGQFGHTYVYKKGKQIYDQANFAAFALGDTDGNGRQEMIGATKIPKHLDDLVIVESLGDNRFEQVFKQPWWSRATRLGVEDIDGDGQTELLRRLPGPNGTNNVLSVSTRDGEKIYELFDSGELFFDQDLVLGSVRAVGDTNGDGHKELLVGQGSKLYYVEMIVEKSDP